MKFSNLLLFTLFCTILYSCNEKSKVRTQAIDINGVTFFQGKWVRVSPNGPISLNFKNDGKVETDFENDNSIEVVSRYKVSNDTIEFFDEIGKTCPESGIYKIYNRGYSMSLDLINDECNGRIKSTMGFWVRPNYKELLSDLNSKIKISDSISYVLNRGRMYLALGKSELAQKDFDVYLAKDSLNSFVFIHRAATKFPFDLKGIVSDCNKSISLDPDNKNAYFLRGLALYELGDKQIACDDFQKAIELGFTILRQAEKDKCEEYWTN